MSDGQDYYQQCVERDSEIARLRGQLALRDHQRMWDLCRYMRHELFEENLITHMEYADLVQDHPAVARLESYDEVRAKLTAAESQVASLTAEIDEWRNREATCCPEDVGFVEYIKTLTAELAEAKKKAACIDRMIESPNPQIRGLAQRLIEAIETTAMFADPKFRSIFDAERKGAEHA